MRAVMGILRPTAGTIRWRGRPMQPDDRLRFGYMPEERGLYPQMRIREQIAYFGELHGVDRATATARADGWLATLDLKGREEDRVIALSHGNQQRVQLAVALVARQEEVNFTSMPFTLPLLAGYLLVYAAIAHPDAGWLKVLSFVPPLAPVLMPARIALGHVAMWQVAVSALLMLAAISGMARVAGRIYAAAIFRGGARVPWKTALRLA